MYDRNKDTVIPMEHLADAAVNQKRGTVICFTVDIDTYAPDGGLFPRGVYHGQDYGFYYQNIRENARIRIAKFLNR